MKLSPEERNNIYEEEKARIESEQRQETTEVLPGCRFSHCLLYNNRSCLIVMKLTMIAENTSLGKSITECRLFTR
mgnify:CR=1 FL=1